MVPKRIMIVGARESGKSTVANLINGVDRKLSKTQDVIYGRYTMDTPSAYLELPYNYKFLVALGQEANVIACLVDATKNEKVYPPRFIESFNCLPIGIVTKAEQATEAGLQFAYEHLKEIGICEHIILLEKDQNGNYSNQSVESLKQYRQYCRVK